MNQVIKVSKKAFIARVNKKARAVVAPHHAVVDTYYKQMVDNDCFLMLVYADGTQKQFIGFRYL